MTKKTGGLPRVTERDAIWVHGRSRCVHGIQAVLHGPESDEPLARSLKESRTQTMSSKQRVLVEYFRWPGFVSFNFRRSAI